MKINVNTPCSVTLTEKGAMWLNYHNTQKIKEYYKILSELHINDATIDKVFPTDFKRGDVVKCLLYELIEMFGEYFDIYIEAPFINNDINLLISEA